MLRDSDLDAAVAEGIVTAAQAVSLRDFVRRRQRERAVGQSHEERFRFMRGFSDIFLAIGTALFVAGFASLVGGGPLGFALSAIVVWALAEGLVARLRLVLPAILLAGLFVGFVFGALPAEVWLGAPRDPTQPHAAAGFFDLMRGAAGGSLALAAKALAAAAAALAFYVRFGVPFALLLMAAAGLVEVMATASILLPATPALEASTILSCGLAIFAAAMAFDISDRERVTSRADSAFWLHLLAAPLIVHSVIRLLSPLLSRATSSGAGPLGLAMTPSLAFAIMLTFAALAVVAIAIDRRALLVSGLSYLGLAIGYAFTGGNRVGPGGSVLAVSGTLAVLGALVLALGVGWVPLRQRLLALFSDNITRRLPPVVLST